MRSRTRPSENTNKKRAWGDEAKGWICTNQAYYEATMESPKICIQGRIQGSSLCLFNAILKLATQQQTLTELADSHFIKLERAVTSDGPNLAEPCNVCTSPNNWVTRVSGLRFSRKWDSES